MKNNYRGEMLLPMTNEEALQGFEEFCETCRKNGAEMGAEIVCNCCKVKRAKEAIEKQITQTADDIRELGKNDKYKYGKCPVCGDGLCNDMNYCCTCGQKINFGEGRAPK